MLGWGRFLRPLLARGPKISIALMIVNCLTRGQPHPNRKGPWPSQTKLRPDCASHGPSL
jgi:hypothetical protein